MLASLKETAKTVLDYGFISFKLACGYDAFETFCILISDGYWMFVMNI